MRGGAIEALLTDTAAMLSGGSTQPLVYCPPNTCHLTLQWALQWGVAHFICHLMPIEICEVLVFLVQRRPLQKSQETVEYSSIWPRSMWPSLFHAIIT